jgi:hypothetical protein
MEKWKREKKEDSSEEEKKAFPEAFGLKVILAFTVYAASVLVQLITFSPQHFAGYALSVLCML